MLGLMCDYNTSSFHIYLKLPSLAITKFTQLLVCTFPWTRTSPPAIYSINRNMLVILSNCFSTSYENITFSVKYFSHYFFNLKHTYHGRLKYIRFCISITLSIYPKETLNMSLCHFMIITLSLLSPSNHKVPFVAVCSYWRLLVQLGKWCSLAP